MFVSERTMAFARLTSTVAVVGIVECGHYVVAIGGRIVLMSSHVPRRADRDEPTPNYSRRRLSTLSNDHADYLGSVDSGRHVREERLRSD